MPSLCRSRLQTSLILLVGLVYCGSAWGQTARQLVEQGISLHNQRQYEKAVQTFEDARLKAPELTRILILLASSHLQLGHLEQAMELYERFYLEQPTPDADEQALLRDGYTASALRLEQEAVRPPLHPELLLLAARACFRLKQLERANALFQRYTQAVREPDEAQRQLRDRYLRDYHDVVLRSLPGRIAQEKDRPELHLLMAESALVVGQDEVALDALELYRESPQPKTPEGRERLDVGYHALLTRWQNPAGPTVLLRGRVHFALNQLVAARHHYDRYRTERPDEAGPYALRLARYEADLQDVLARQQAEANARQAQTKARLLQLKEQERAQAATEYRRIADERVRANRWMIWTGVVGMGVGAGLVAFGVAGISYDGRCINDTQPCDRVYDSLKLGIGTTAAGGALLLGGGAMVGLGLYRSRPPAGP